MRFRNFGKIPSWPTATGLSRIGAVVLLAFGTGTSASAQIEPAARQTIASEPAGYGARIKTDRVILLAKDGEATAAELVEYAAQLGAAAIRVRELLGFERAPDVRLIVILDGSGLPTEGEPNIPHVDRQGRVFLYRYQEDHTDYLASAAHEIVHAYRRAARTGYAGFAEEGLAQAIALSVDPERQRFPRYGYPIPIAAGHLLAREENIPLRDLWRNHRTLSGRCSIQAYVLRESFFEFLERRFTLDPILGLVYGERTGREENWVNAFSASFDELAADWRTDLLTAYEANPQREVLANRYRTESPAQYQPFCQR